MFARSGAKVDASAGRARLDHLYFACSSTHPISGAQSHEVATKEESEDHEYEPRAQHARTGCPRILPADDATSTAKTPLHGFLSCSLAN